jgi:CRP-like cAMP-binding protein
MPNPWISKMEQFTRFTDGEKRVLDELLTERRKTFRPGEPIIADGGYSRDVHVIVSGLACRSKLLDEGERQIMAFLVPGDLCDAEIFILKAMDHDVIAMVPTDVALISGAKMKELLRGDGCLAEALWWGTLTDLAVLRERIIDVGRRGAHERLAHLFYEMLIRYRIVGLAHDYSFDFPVTQADLADATGLSVVHLNRTLQTLRAEELIAFENKRVTVLDAARLKAAARFHSDYLHLDRAHDPQDGMSRRAGDLV